MKIAWMGKVMKRYVGMKILKVQGRAGPRRQGD